MKTETYRVELEFITPLLGSQPGRAVATSYLAQKHGFEIPEDEVETLTDALEQGTTVFHRRGRGDELILYDYQVKGAIKNAGQVLNGVVSGKVKNLRSKVVNRVFVSPRTIPLVLPEGGEIDIIERPLRAQTAQGERVALARSEMVPEGTRITFGLMVYPGEITEAVLRDLLDYGYHNGIGQWRGGGYGRFTYTLTREDDEE